MVLCTRCQELDVKTSVRATNCSIVGGGPCSACKEDMELEQKIQELQEKRRHLRTKMNANHDPFVLRLPPEIGSHIFCLSMDELDTPYLFGSVCGGWRQLARATPQLWTTLAFSPPRRMDSTLMETVPHLVVDWLERSGGLPLSLDVSYFVSNSAGFPQEVLLSIINAVTQHSGRWHDVRFDLPLVYFQHFRPTSPPQNLRKFSILSSRDPDADISKSPRLTMNTGPGPMEFSIESISAKAFEIAWDRLVQLEVNATSLDGVLEVIRDAPVLKICSLVNISAPIVEVSEAIIYHPHLQTLALLELRKEVFTKIINSLELPSLKSCSFGSDGVIGIHAISFLRRFGSGLTSFHLVHHEEPPIEDFNRLLQVVSHVQRLKLVGAGLSLAMDNILEQLAASSLSHPAPQKGDDAGFFSKLQSLEFFGRLQLSDLNWACIPLIFQSPHRKLLGLDIKIDLDHIDISDEVSNELVRLVDQGIKLRIYDLYSEQDYLQIYRQFESRD